MPYVGPGLLIHSIPIIVGGRLHYGNAPAVALTKYLANTALIRLCYEAKLHHPGALVHAKGRKAMPLDELGAQKGQTER